MKQAAIHGLVLALTITLAGCGGDKTKSGNGKNGGDGGVTVDQSTPEKTAASIKAAMARRDWAAAFACMTEESKTELTLELIVAADFVSKSDPGKRSSLETVLKQHEIKAGGIKQFPLHDVKNMAALFGDLIAWLKENAPAGAGRVADQWTNLEFSNFQTKDDEATADLAIGREPPGPRKFTKIDGKWYAALSDTKAKKTGPKPFPKQK